MTRSDPLYVYQNHDISDKREDKELILRNSSVSVLLFYIFCRVRLCPRSRNMITADEECDSIFVNTTQNLSSRFSAVRRDGAEKPSSE